MKEFWKKYRTGIVIGAISVAVLVVVVHVVLILCGFHFTYSPNVHNDWNAVSGVAAWVSIFVSSLLSIAAIWYAIQVPKKIADRQDKIALFEKRFLVYDELLKHKEFSKDIKDDTSDLVLFAYWQSSFCTSTNLYNGQYFLDGTTVHLLQQIPFLFANVDAEDCRKLLDAVVAYARAAEFPSYDVSQEYVRQVDQFVGKYEQNFELAVSLK